MRKQYHFWPSERGFDAWDVERLIELSRDLPVVRVAVQEIGEIDTEYRFAGSGEVPTRRRVIEHALIERRRLHTITDSHTSERLVVPRATPEADRERYGAE